MEKKQKFTLIDIGTIKHYMGDYSVSTQISIKQREYLSILVHQQFTDITGKVSDELIEIEQGNFAPFYELIEKALWKCLDIEADLALKLDQHAAN
jgi:hypothetical protein